MSDPPLDRAALAALKQEQILEFERDRWLAHKVLFANRHTDDSAPAHRELTLNIYKPRARLLVEGFRGIGKTTTLEEVAIIRSLYREHRFMVILGASYTRACDRLEAIKNELVVNSLITHLYGSQKGHIWQDGKIVLSNGVCIAALGRDQSITGMKYLDWRPDAALVDDVEDPEENRNDAEREGTWRWFIKTFLPSLDHPLRSWVRVLGTRRGSGSLPERLEKDGWNTVRYPVEYISNDGRRVATWPSKFPLDIIDEMKATYRGDMDTWMQEYMCEATSTADRVFRSSAIKIAPRVRTHEPVWAMYDPARTVGARSATTGKAVWSWVRNKLVVWGLDAQRWMPTEIIDDIFRCADDYDPVAVGFEEDGLNEWIKEPLHHEQVRRGCLIPMKAMRAPRDKNRFIGALEWHFTAGEVEFTENFPAISQFLSFPHGPKDAPNALAYALTLRPGTPIYDGFTGEHIAESLQFDRTGLWLACNATRGLTTAVALQYGVGRTHLLADWAIDSEPAEAIPLIIREVGMRFRAAPTACCGPQHYQQYMNTGLVQALQRVPLTVERGVEPRKGRDVLRTEFARLTRDFPAVQVAATARHTVNALHGGYSRPLSPTGALADEAEAGLYRVLMEGLESCLGRMAASADMDDDTNWYYTPSGQRYRRYGMVERRMQ
jgi:hypothetical protein